MQQRHWVWQRTHSSAKLCRVRPEKPGGSPCQSRGGPLRRTVTVALRVRQTRRHFIYFISSPMWRSVLIVIHFQPLLSEAIRLKTKKLKTANEPLSGAKRGRLCYKSCLFSTKPNPFGCARPRMWLQPSLFPVHFTVRGKNPSFGTSPPLQRQTRRIMSHHVWFYGITVVVFVFILILLTF